MKAEILISLISAVSLHAGLFCIGGGHRDLPHSATEIEIGLEAGDEAPATGLVDEPAPSVDSSVTETVEAQPILPPVPPPELAAPAPAPTEAPAQEPAPSPPTPPAEPPPVQQAAAEPKPVTPAPKPAPQPRKTAKVSVSRNAGKPSGKASAGDSGRGSNISSARYRFRAPLRYPASALAQHAGGTVVLVIEINDAGRAVDVTVRQGSGHRDLDASAMQCAMASRYEPYRVNGQAEPCSVVAPFRFEPR